jgi:CRISPR/Cas system-associated exonuclease Cas4 (RecB family)
VVLAGSLVDWILGARPRGECGVPGLLGWELGGPGGVWPSDLGVGCPTGRAVWLRRRVGLGRSTLRMEAGSRSHGEALRVWRAAVERGFDGLLGEVRGGVSGVGGLWAAGSALRWLVAGRPVPVAVEPPIEGWAGFSGGRPDLLVGFYPVELADTPVGSPYWARKRLVVAAYAVMIEAMTGHPVTAGYLVSLRDGRVERVCVDDRLRGEMLREAEKLAAALEADPGLPSEGPSACPESCPFRMECWGGPVDSQRGEARVGVEA